MKCGKFGTITIRSSTMKKLSICIAVYNQIELVKKNLDLIMQYRNNDIEVVISDDCSTDDIQGLAESYGDKRIVYVKTKQNGGHDLNILNALEAATGEYALVLRSRDLVIPEKISNILETINSNEECGYYLFSALDETGVQTLFLSDKKYESGKDAIYAHRHLITHPSGNIYNLQFVDCSKLRIAINKSFSHKYGFTVHELLRMELACKGPFYTSKDTTWIYANTINQKDTAVNSLPNKQSVYDPKYGYERLTCCFYYIKDSIDTTIENKYLLYKEAFRKYFKSITYDFGQINKSKGHQQHYNFSEIIFSPQKERINFIHKSKEMLSEIDNTTRNKVIHFLYKYSILLAYYYPVRDYFFNHFFSLEVKRKIAKAIRHL